MHPLQIIVFFEDQVMHFFQFVYKGHSLHAWSEDHVLKGRGIRHFIGGSPRKEIVLRDSYITFIPFALLLYHYFQSI